MCVVIPIEYHVYIWLNCSLFVVIFTLLYSYGAEINKKGNIHQNKVSSRLLLFFLDFVRGLRLICGRYLKNIFACSEYFFHNINNPHNIKTDHVDGSLVKLNDCNELEEIIITVIKHRGKRSKYGKQSKINIGRFTEGEIIDKSFHLFNT